MKNGRKPSAQQRISKRTDTDGYVYNPSGIPVGDTSKFKVGLDPMTGFTEDDIVWDNLGSISFVNNDNHGPEVTVRGDSTGEFFLSLAVNGMELTPIPAFFVKVMTPTTAPVTVWIVRNDTGGDAPIAESAILPIIDDANKILKQKALTLQWSGTANYTNREEWLDITDAMNPTNAVLNALLNCTNNTGGVEIYFINSLQNNSSDDQLNGVNDYLGLALAKGRNDAGGFNGRVMAHEVLHQCGLKDIYVRETDKTTLFVDGPISKERLPNDWGNGYYPKGLTQEEVVRKLIIYGRSGRYDPEPRIDLPSGSVYGLCNTNAPYTGDQIWYLDKGKVGQSSITDQTPNHY